jgi:hypothetical protein
MTCRTCGTEIADKALICFRCGAPTSEPVRQAAPARRAGPSRFLTAVVMVLLVLAALFLGRAAPMELPPAASYGIAAFAAAVLAWRMWRRRRR